MATVANKAKETSKNTFIPNSGIPVLCVSKDLIRILPIRSDAVRVEWHPEKLDQVENLPEVLPLNPSS
jgi:hypothetical protein